MANVIHRTTLQFIASANTPDYPEPTWKHGPDMTAVAAVPSRYWKAPADWNAVGAGPVEMTQGEKDAVDAAIATAARQAAATVLDNAEDIVRAMMLTILDEFNLHAARQTSLLAQIAAATSLANLQSRVASNVTAIPQRTTQQLRTAIAGKLGS